MARNTSPTTELSLSFEALRLNHEKRKEEGEEEEGSINPSQIINHGGLEWRENSSRVSQSNYSYPTTTEPVKQECIQKSNHLFKENHEQQDNDALRRDCPSSEATPCVCSCHSQDDKITCFLCDCHAVQSLPDQHHQAVGVVGGGAILSTCRQEAMYNDVSVEELAGYFDELLYLPRPMSVMAELMYT